MSFWFHFPRTFWKYPCMYRKGSRVSGMTQAAPPGVPLGHQANIPNFFLFPLKQGIKNILFPKATGFL